MYVANLDISLLYVLAIGSVGVYTAKVIPEYSTCVPPTISDSPSTTSKGATEEIIKALQDVIQDFNTNLTEQFGDNFKHNT
jgi:hypothetical protein